MEQKPMEKELSLPRGAAKKDGALYAREWCKSAPDKAQKALAESDFRYGDTLSQWKEHGVDVPQSEDVDFSWGFYKQVRGKIHHVLRFATHSQE